MRSGTVGQNRRKPYIFPARPHFLILSLSIPGSDPRADPIPIIFLAPLHSPMKTLETARTTDCCDQTGGRRPRSLSCFSFVLCRASKLPSAPNGSVELGPFLLPWRAPQATHAVRSRFSRPGAAFCQSLRQTTTRRQRVTLPFRAPVLGLVSLHYSSRAFYISFSAVQILMDLSLKILHQNIKSHRRAE